MPRELQSSFELLLLLANKSIYKGCIVTGPHYDKYNNRNRVRINSHGKIINMNYSRFIMECHLDRYLDTDEEVHHIDENTLNDKLANLEIKSKSQHTTDHNQIYFDMEQECFICKTKFIWTGKAQNIHHKNLKAGNKKDSNVVCSYSCASKKGWLS